MNTDKVLRARVVVLVVVLLALMTVALYWPATKCDFTNCDDDIYVASANAQVQNGLTFESVQWAFLNPVSGNWHPLTMLSHMLDCRLYGSKPWGHHLTGLLLHALNTVLVFLLLRRMTGALWRSAAVAALFGWHPLHVESVAWVAERKDVLSTCFGLLALIFYVRYAQAKIGARRAAIGSYLLALLFFALGLMSKAMLVTMPFVMLLLDYWPLQRFKTVRARTLVVEKIPFLVLAAAACVVTFMAQKQGDAVMTVEGLALDTRVENALISYCRYLGKIFWPVNLAVYYPHPGYWPLEQVLLASVILCGISWIFFAQRNQHPFLLTGWLWFVGTLVPVIGLVQVGEQAMADRYTYIPSLGIFILAVWGACELTRRWRYRMIVLSALGLAAIVLCLGVTRKQIGYWRNSESLFSHALAVTDNNAFAHVNLGLALLDNGQPDAAISQFQEAISCNPAWVNGHVNLGVALLNQGQPDGAIRQFQEAILLKPENIIAQINLGLALLRKGEIDAAISQYQKTLRLNPDDANAQSHLAWALELKRRMDLYANDPSALNNMAWELATSSHDPVRNGALAVKLAERACEQTHDQVTVMLGTLAAAYAEAGRFDEAVATARKACDLAGQHDEKDLLRKNRELLELYQSGRAFHQESKAAGASP